MTRYVFETPEQMFHWIDSCALKLLSIPRSEFGKINIDITRTKDNSNWDFNISEQDLKAWKEKLNDKS